MSQSIPRSKSLQNIAYSKYPDVEKEKIDTFVLDQIHARFTVEQLAKMTQIELEDEIQNEMENQKLNMTSTQGRPSESPELPDRHQETVKDLEGIMDKSMTKMETPDIIMLSTPQKEIKGSPSMQLLPRSKGAGIVPSASLATLTVK